jgi:hypothetical protein
MNLFETQVKIKTRAISDIGTILCLMAAILFILFFGFFVYQEYREHQARQNLPLVKREFNQVQPLPGAVSTSDTWSTVAACAVTVGLTYRTNLPYNEVRAYYDAELPKHGFKFQKESEAYGQKHISYSKDDLTAFINYAGETNSEYTHYFRVSWHC